MSNKETVLPSKKGLLVSLLTIASIYYGCVAIFNNFFGAPKFNDNPSYYITGFIVWVSATYALSYVFSWIESKLQKKKLEPILLLAIGIIAIWGGNTGSPSIMPFGNKLIVIVGTIFTAMAVLKLYRNYGRTENLKEQELETKGEELKKACNK